MFEKGRNVAAEQVLKNAILWWKVLLKVDKGKITILADLKGGGRNKEDVKVKVTIFLPRENRFPFSFFKQTLLRTATRLIGLLCSRINFYCPKEFDWLMTDEQIKINSIRW